MKVYISVDMEGASGICCKGQTSKDSPMYQQGRKLLTGDVNAAIEGAIAGGATEVIVADMHNGSFNIDYEDLHPNARIIYGVPHAGPRFPYLDNSVDAMFLVAYHAKAGTQWGTLEHTMSSVGWHKLKVNGKEIGETAYDAALAGEVGVPVVLVTGDDKVCKEARELLGCVCTAEVKKGLGRERALCMPLQDARQRIYSAAKEAMRLVGKAKPFRFSSPVHIELTYKHTPVADGTSLLDKKVRRIDGYTIEYQCERFSDWAGGGTWEMVPEELK